ncbi:MAG: inositol monophosphatase family protein [Planctomycetota bacterium]
MTATPLLPPDHTSLYDIEEQAVAIVQRVARQLVLPSFGGLGAHHWVSHTQVHTAADEIAGSALHEAFSAAFPEHGLVIEDRPTIAGSGRWEWFIDPIDGSANHLRGIPYVSVSAGLCCDGEPVVGVVHDLLRDQTLSACRGGGARLRLASGDTRPARVARTSGLRNAMIIAHLSRRGPLVNIPGALHRILWQTRKIRCMGSIALDLALLAAGEADLLIVGRGGPQRMLDIQGGLVVLAEAGGVVMTAAGGPISAQTRTLLAGPPDLCRLFVEQMSAYDLEGWRQEQAQAPD